MNTIKNILDSLSEDEDIQVDEIPSLDLYMDQILTLFSDRLLDKGFSTEELLTKTMINNYSKEGIITPVKGKKYTKEQIIQLLCIMNLKQNLSLVSIKKILNLMFEEQSSISDAYSKSIQSKKIAREELSLFLENNLDKNFDSDNAEDVLALSLNLSSMASYLKKIADTLINDLDKKK